MLCRFDIDEKTYALGSQKDPASDIFFLEDLRVNPEKRSNGLGAELLRRVEEYAINHGYRQIVGVFSPDDDMDFDRVRSFYNNNGYRIEIQGASNYEIEYIVKDLEA